MAKIKKEVDHGVRRVDGIEIRINELVWADGASSFEAFLVATDEDLTLDECFDALPTDDQLRTVMKEKQ